MEIYVVGLVTMNESEVNELKEQFAIDVETKDGKQNKVNFFVKLNKEDARRLRTHPSVMDVEVATLPTGYNLDNSGYDNMGKK